MLLAAVLIGFINVKAQNPFAEYGYEPKIATLSQGKYNESFDNDTVVQIGSVLFNTKSKQIVAFVVTDTLYSESDLQPDIVSRWLSPDPLEKEYPSWSPYNFTLCNPIYFIDPDGRGVFPSKKDLKTQGEKTVADDNFKQDPTTKQTYCNQGTCDILNASGDNSLNGLTANQIGDKLRDKDFATEITPQEALDYANQGVTVIASYRSTSGSGHVAVVAPGEALTPTGSGWKDKNEDYAKGLVNVFNVGPSAYQGVKNLKEAIGGGKAGSTGLYIMKADLITLNANKQQSSSNTTPAPQYQTSTGTIAPAVSTNVVLPIIKPIIPQ